MVLIRPFRRFTVLGLVLLMGCNQSLFDAHGAAGGGGGGGDDDAGSGTVASSCVAPCLADAAADFDGSPGGVGNHWRYLDDHRDRTWTPMSASSTVMTGADPGNLITTCAAKPTAPACKALPGALLVSSAGATSKADPAVEFTASKAQVLKLSIHAFVPGGGADDDQTIRIYRNSREDVLFTGIALAGAALDQAITLDALPGDRFLVAVAPSTTGATDVGLQVFVNPTTANFPSTCQVAIQFTAGVGNTVDNLCGTDFTHSVYQDTGTDLDTAPAFAAGPFPELGNAGDFIAPAYFRGVGILDKTHDVTLQFWAKRRSIVNPDGGAWLFSDMDLDDAVGPKTSGGLAIVITNDPQQLLDVQTCTESTPTTLNVAEVTTPYPSDASWQFVRIVHTGGTVSVCLNGTRRTTLAVEAGHLQSAHLPRIGMNEFSEPAGAFFDGEIDDFRVLTGALPCDP